jgi:hypothetical protein
MIRSKAGAAGSFSRPRASRVFPTDNAIAASLAISALSLCLAVTLTVLAIKVSVRCRFHCDPLISCLHLFQGHFAIIDIATGQR